MRKTYTEKRLQELQPAKKRIRFKGGDSMIKGIKSKLSDKRFWFTVIFKGIFYALEFVVVAFAFHRLQATAVNYVTEHATPSTMGFFKDYSIMIQTEDGKLLSMFQGITLMALVGVPFMYLLVWLHRLLKWFAIEDLKSQLRDLRNERELLQQQLK
jgi:hypothetical protein